MPRERVLKDDALAEIAMQMPQSREAMAQLRALPRGFGNSRTGDAILKAVKEGLARDPKSLPAIEAARDDMSPRPRPPPKS